MSDEPFYYIRLRGKVSGPYALAAIKDMVRRGRVTRMHQVSTDGRAWHRASEDAEVFPTLNQGTLLNAAMQDTLELAESRRSASGEPASAPSVAAAEATPKWYYAVDDHEVGPVSTAQLRQRASEGVVGLETLVWRPGLPAWMTAGEATELRETLRASGRGGPGQRIGDMVFCRGCGERLHSTAAACPHCGAVQAGGEGKSKAVACLLALFLGGLGIHRFYLGQWWGVFYLLLFWTLIPAVVALVEAIIFFATDEVSWKRKYGKVK